MIREKTADSLKQELSLKVTIQSGNVAIESTKNVKTGMSDLTAITYDGLPLGKPEAKKVVLALLQTLRRKYDILYFDEFHAKKRIFNALRGNATQN